MGVFEVIVVFAGAWWLIFLPILSAGTRSQHEADAVIPGTERAAPEKIAWLPKLLIATGGRRRHHFSGLAGALSGMARLHDSKRLSGLRRPPTLRHSRDAAIQPDTSLLSLNRAFDASFPLFPAGPQGGARRRADRVAPADAARGHDPAGGGGHLCLAAAGHARAEEDRADRARGEDRAGRDRTADADHCSWPTCGARAAATTPTAGDAAHQGPARARDCSTARPTRR